MMRRTVLALAALAALAAPQPAAAVDDCDRTLSTTVVASGQGRLESIVSDGRGRLFYTDLNGNRLLRLDRPGAVPVVLASIAGPGGLAWDPSGDLVVGYNGNGFAGLPGNGLSGLYLVNPDTGAIRPFASGLDQANGLARSDAGNYYTSNVVSGDIAEVSPSGTHRQWTRIDSANGLAIDRRSRYLYAATSLPARVVRFDLADPSRSTFMFDGSQDPEVYSPDGLTVDGSGHLFVAANASGEIWRITDEGTCAVAHVPLPSNVAFGGSSGRDGFSSRNLYAVTFAGDVVELTVR